MNKLTLQNPVPLSVTPAVPPAVQGPPAPAGTPATAAQDPGPADRPQAGLQPERQAGPQAEPQPAAEPAPAPAPPQAPRQDAPGATVETESNQGKSAEPAPEYIPDASLDSSLNTGLNTGPDAGPDTALSAADLDRIAARLRGGEVPLAARGDLVELHNRITRMFATLNEGLGDMHSRKAAADREILSSRIDMLEAAVNRMEGALRIEFEPLLKAALDEALAKQAPPRRRGLARRLMVLVLVLALGLGLGTWQHQPLQSFAAELQSQLQPGLQSGLQAGLERLGLRPPAAPPQ